MENNDNPYIYEKPLRSKRFGQGAKRGKRVAKLSVLGLVGMVGIFGGSAIANNATTSSKVTATSAVNADAKTAPVIAVPLQEAKPKSHSGKIDLPARSNQGFENEND